MSGQVAKVHEIADGSFDQNTTERYKLSIQLLPDGFSFAVFDDDLNKFIALYSFEFQSDKDRESKEYFHGLSDGIKQVLNREEWISKPFISLDAIWEDKYYAFVPADLFNKDKQKTYLAFSQNLNDKSELLIKNDYLENLDSYVIYSIPKVINEAINQYFPKCKNQSHLSVLTKCLPGSSLKSANRKIMYANVRKGNFDILVYEGGKLLLANAYDYNSPEDLLYFISFVAGQYHIDTQYLVIRLLGQIEENTLPHRLLGDYLPGLKFVNQCASYQFADALNHLPKHIHFTSFNLIK